jgi:hypothetical protein
MLVLIKCEDFCFAILLVLDYFVGESDENIMSQTVEYFGGSVEISNN